MIKKSPRDVLNTSRSARRQHIVVDQVQIVKEEIIAKPANIQKNPRDAILK
jgi:hypothetical protein